MRPTTMRRSDAFFLVALVAYLVALIAGIVMNNFKFFDQVLLWFTLYLLAGAAIKAIPNPLQRWFNSNILLFGPKPLSPDEVIRLMQGQNFCEYPSLKIFPPVGIRGVVYFAMDNHIAYFWISPEKGYVQIQQQDNGELAIRTFRSLLGVADITEIDGDIVDTTLIVDGNPEGIFYVLDGRDQYTIDLTQHVAMDDKGIVTVKAVRMMANTIEPIDTKIQFLIVRPMTMFDLEQKGITE
jgi:hypothetical protein